MLPLMEAIPASCQLVPERVGMESGVQARGPRSRVTPIAPQRFAIHASDRPKRPRRPAPGAGAPGTPAALGRCRSGARARAPIARRRPGEAEVAATEQPQRKPRPTASRRHIPAHVKRAVWGRDGGQCTYVGENGRHCASRTRLEFDHIDPVALGGEATVDRMRLRCRAHNQYTAACELGTQFMSDKRHSARQHAAANARARAAARQREAPASAVAADRDVVPWLRQLGYRAEEARAAARFCESAPDDTLEDRVRLALSYFRPRTTRQGRVACPAG